MLAVDHHLVLKFPRYNMAVVILAGDDLIERPPRSQRGGFSLCGDEQHRSLAALQGS